MSTDEFIYPMATAVMRPQKAYVIVRKTFGNPNPTNTNPMEYPPTNFASAKADIRNAARNYEQADVVPSDVADALSTLASANGRANAALLRLAARLEPILLPSQPTTDTPAMKPETGRCQIALAIFSNAVEAEDAANRIEGLLSRLGV